MNNILTLFKNDMKRLFQNVITGIIVMGLVLLPSIFSWYNILASWDVFGNTGNLTVAVANNDKGFKSDLVPLKVDMGEQVVSSLRENDQLNWTFTNEEDAIDGARSGRYYAAVVIPEGFSEDMLTFYSDDVEHAQIIYYTNEKKSAVAPKVTSQGADQVSYQVNVVFTETLSELALNIASMLNTSMDNADVSGQVGQLARHISTMGSQLNQASTVLTTYAQVMDSSQALVAGSADLLGQAQGSVDQVSSAAGEGREAISTISDALDVASSSLSDAIDASASSYDGMDVSVDTALDASQDLSTTSVTALRDQSAAIDKQLERYRAFVKTLEGLKATSSDPDSIQAIIDQLNDAIDLQEQLSATLLTAADKLEQGNTDLADDRDAIHASIADAKAALQNVKTDYDNDVKPSMDALSTQVAQAVSQLDGNAGELRSTTDTLRGSADSVTGQLCTARDKLNTAAASLADSSTKLNQLSLDMTAALASDDLDQIRTLLTSDTAQLSSALAAPVELERIPVFPADNFGSQMAPLYTTLALWIGSLLLLVGIRANVSNKAQRELNNPKLYQLFLGRFGCFAVLSLAQSTVMAVGNLVFLGVQANEPLLYLICFWLSGLVFTFIIYSLVVSFANLGKAIAVFLLIIQVTSGGGSFPLPILPEFFQMLSPYLPATHVINAMRAAMMGVFENDFWIQIAQLLVFVIPFALLGLVLRKPLMRFLHGYIKRVEDSKLVV